MKKFLFLAMVLLVCGLTGIMFISCGGDDDGGGDVRADVAINETNFPDAIFRNWLLSQDYGSDGVLTAAEIATVTKINVSEKIHTTSLKGIEFFTALTELNCNLIGLKTLDLSKNTKLISLSCYGNQLTSLNVTRCSALKTLKCHGNLLKALDVSGCTTLTELNCWSNELKELNLSKNTMLISLDCNLNQLTTLDVSGLTKLKYLHCYTNKLTMLTLSNNWNLKELYCYQNQIKGEGMDALVASLPTVSSGGDMYVIYHSDEKNLMTTTQVAAAKAKKWEPRYYNFKSKTWKVL